MHGGNVWQGEAPSAWLDFSANLRPEGPPDWVRSAMLEAMENARYYPDVKMHRARQALSEYLQIDASCVLPTAGGVSAISLVNRLPSRETLVFTPCFCEYEQYAQSPIRKISLLCDGRRIAIPETLDLPKGALVWFCNPMNPVGYAFDAAQMQALLEKVEAAEGYLAVDEAFIEYCEEYSVIQWVKAHERLMITGSFTKILGIPGVRLGYLCAQPQILNRLKEYQLPWELNCFAEAAACALPRHRADVRADAQANAERRAELTKALREMGVFVYPGASACILVDFGRNVAPIEEGLKRKKILVRSCMSFDDIADGRHLRLAVKDEASNRRLIQALKEEMLCAENR